MGPGFLITAILFQAASTVPTEELQRGKNAYDRGEFSRAVEIVRPLLYPEIRLESDNKMVQAHRILGVSYLFENKQDEAALEFRRLLQIAPDYHFDPLLDPPEVVDFFNTVRKAYAGELAQLEAKRKEAEQARQRDLEQCEKVRGGPSVIERRVGRNSFVVNFVPFGAGQFQNGQRKKAWAFLFAESVLGSASVGAFATNLALYGFRPQRTCRVDSGAAACPSDLIDHTQENRSRWLYRVQLASGAMFFGAIAWGILDALYYYEPETQLSMVDAAKRAASSATLRLSPTVIQRTIGPALSFRF